MRINAFVPQPLDRDALEAHEKERSEGDDREKNHEPVGPAAGETLRERQKLQDEQANGDPDEERASKIEKYCDKNISSDALYLRRWQVLNISTETFLDLKYSQGALD